MIQVLRRAHGGLGGGGCSGVAEHEDQERRIDEYVKLCFEIFKHLTTLSTAGALVVLAVYREVSVETWLVATTFPLFGMTILISLFSMLIAAGYFASTSSPPSQRLLIWCLTGASITFIAAVTGFMLIPLQLPQWLSLVALIVLLPLLVVPLYRFLRQRRGGPAQQEEGLD
jgi:hypothetical protein